MVEQSERDRPADAVPTHCGMNVETPHPQRSRHIVFYGHASYTGERLADISAKQPFAVMFESGLAGRPFLDEARDMLIAFPPGLALESYDLLRQSIADFADIDRHGDADLSRRREQGPSGAAPA